MNFIELCVNILGMEKPAQCTPDVKMLDVRKRLTLGKRKTMFIKDVGWVRI